MSFEQAGRQAGKETTFLVTGGAGFIGSHLVDALLAAGNRVVVLDNLSVGKRSNVAAGARLFEGDVCDESLVRRLMDEVDGCFHLAALSSTVLSHQQWLYTHRVNVGGTVTVLECARATALRPAVPVVYASSAAVYGDNTDSPLSEQAKLQPFSAYGADKLGSELHARVAGLVHGVPTVGLRLFNVFGPRQDPYSPYSGVISHFLLRAQNGEDLLIHGDGEQVRDFVHVQDAVRFLRTAMQFALPNGRIFNVCTGRPTAILELAHLIIHLTGKGSRIQHTSARVGDIRISIGDPRLALQSLDIATLVDLREGLSEMIASNAVF
ncbi:NAD-dependent epimerase/dehydratase family protein [Candidatus Magnetaquicoccus inordinatus]|uniref:NAD-dependent epimerase/dehydratase family protein n=1 Tax=Candidatus Magnetaquicoccus inordinatus TaxID=2496818 RepID=UPI00102B7A03|nr:NAD-dependent epimerase/dehydratase family protein [Candidatus Magnetaquicoccus inordinatus]